MKSLKIGNWIFVYSKKDVNPETIESRDLLKREKKDVNPKTIESRDLLKREEQQDRGPSLEDKLNSGEVITNPEEIRMFIELLRNSKVKEFNALRESNGYKVIDFMKVLPQTGESCNHPIFENLLPKNGVKIPGANLSYVILRGSDFRGDNLGSVVFDNSRFQDCDFRSYAGYGRTNLDIASSYFTDFTKSDFRDSNIFRMNGFDTIKGNNIDKRQCIQSKHIDDWTLKKLFELTLKGDPDYKEPGVKPQRIGKNMSFVDFLAQNGYFVQDDHLKEYKVVIVNGNYCGSKGVNIVNMDPETMLILGYHGQRINFGEIFKNKVVKAVETKNLKLESQKIKALPSSELVTKNLTQDKSNYLTQDKFNDIITNSRRHNEHSFHTHCLVYSMGPIFCYNAHLQNHGLISASNIIFTRDSFPRGVVAAENILINEDTFTSHAGFARGKIVYYKGGI